MSISLLREYIVDKSKEINVHYKQDDNDEIDVKDLLLCKYKPKIFESDGIVKYNDLEGGFYYVELPDGKTITPLNFDDYPNEKINNTTVYIKYILADNMVSFYMFGTLVEINFISQNLY